MNPKQPFQLYQNFRLDYLDLGKVTRLLKSCQRKNSGS